MKQILLLLITIACFSNCRSSKKTRTTTSTKIITKKVNSTSKADKIINYAKKYMGVRYKYGGTTKSGMDCSGLVQISFKAHDIMLPRSSRDMAQKGHKISLKKVKKGDLLFFRTNKKRTISHVGLIVAIRNNDIEFIHATTRRGVIISKLNETYWLNAFSEARRVL